VADIDLRGYSFLDSLQPQYAAFLGTVAQGFLPLAGDASLYVEISPGIEINRLTDVALKATKVKPGMQVVERYFGLLEVHSPSQAETRAAGAAILAEISAKESDRIKPRIASSQIIRRIDDHQAQLINRMRHGQMIIPGQTLYLLEMDRPCAIAEAERLPNINVLGAILRIGGQVYSAVRSGTSTSAGAPRWPPSRVCRVAKVHDGVHSGEYRNERENEDPWLKHWE
jgi:hypothetical protein